MLPGVAAGHYAPQDAEITLAPLAEQARALFVEQSAAAIDAAARTVTLADGRRAEYDLLSVDVGSVQSRDTIAGAREHGVGVGLAKRRAQVGQFGAKGKHPPPRRQARHAARGRVKKGQQQARVALHRPRHVHQHDQRHRSHQQPGPVFPAGRLGDQRPGVEAFATPAVELRHPAHGWRRCVQRPLVQARSRPIPVPSSDRTWQPVLRSVVPCQHGAALVQRAWHGPHTPADRTKPADSAATRARGCACGPAADAGRAPPP